MPYDKKPGAVTRMYDKKGKPTGLMMEGSVNHMESALQHAGKSKLHVKPGKDYPGDGHLHYDEKGNKVESPGVSETKKLSDTSGAVGQMSPYKFTGMSGGSAMHNGDPELEKAIAKRKKIEEIRLQKQENIEKKDINRNALEKKKQELRKEKKKYKVQEPRIEKIN